MSPEGSTSWRGIIAPADATGTVKKTELRNILRNSCWETYSWHVGRENMSPNLPTGAVAYGFAPAPQTVTSTDLHARTKEAIDRVRSGSVLAVTHYNEVEAYLLPAAWMRDLVERLEQGEALKRELQETLPLVLAAMQAGVAIPSETLRHIAPGLDDSWEAISDYVASYPLRLSGGENGEPLTRGRLRGVGGLPESGDDSELNFDA